ncbi:MAG TPA: myo-inosose-2 dehydratase [Lacunisphaera sp.]|jgi:inosose dehydratase|nr:myo-inosose-2 dehydratase [Lacunisphaera sp.]HQY05777.1 myo-inosose-2 dehydratase [Lacunisphaera sp.]
MIASAPVSAPVLADCQVGANPIIWSNDDFNDLAGDVPLDVILREMHAAGFAGSELGHAYPRTSSALGAALDRHRLKLVSGWHSTYLAGNDYAAEEQAFQAHLALLKSLGAPVIIVAECTRCVHGERDTALGFGDHDRPRLTEAEWPRLCAGLTKFAALSAAAGLKLVYHHHMGTVIQSEAELDRLLAGAPAMHLLFDPGHLAFAGIDPLAVARRHGARIAHVHLKSVRREVAEQVRREGWSFYRAVRDGVFTIPGDGLVDFPAIFAVLAQHHYRGWLVVEAEEDPVKVAALPKAKKARDYVRTHAGV